MKKFYLNECGMLCSLGSNLTEIRQQLLEHAVSALSFSDEYSPERKLPIGRVRQDLPDLAAYPLRFRSRNNQMALAALQQIRAQVDAMMQKYGRDRVAIILGTSTSGMSNTEAALAYQLRHGDLPEDFHYAQQEMGSCAEFLAYELGSAGPAYVHSSACASSAKAMASAARLLDLGVCDAVITGGVDTLCRFTVAGFSALESLSPQQCNPLSVNRMGINIGEGVGLFLMSREPSRVALCGWGESSDAYHISAPDPSGKGALSAMQQALVRAGIQANQVDYINMHGTATPHNDAMEALAIHQLFSEQVKVSSTKPFTGHALGAAAALEAGFCWLLMQDDNPQGCLPVHLWDGVTDSALPHLNLVQPKQALGRAVQWCLSNSFAFGGSNASLVLGRMS
jgi:3-oxoacyl-[acyl-carrier-protein] synthase-1